MPDAERSGAGLDRPLQRAHLRPSRLPGLRRGAGRALRHRRRHARDRRQSDRGQRHRLPGSLHHALSGNLVADARGCIRCSAMPRRSPPASPRRCGSRARPEVRVVAQGGDGGTTDIGFGCLSGMFERNDDVLYICYDNEGYMNTGVQRSSATPPAARTATTPAGGPGARQCLRHRQDRAADRHGARHSLCRDRHRRRPARPRAQGAQGHEHCTARATSTSCALPARLGHGLARHHPAGAAGRGKPACSRSSRPSTATSPAVAKIRRKVPVEEYLKPQKRFAHLFKDEHGAPRTSRRSAGHRRPQHRANTSCCERRGTRAMNSTLSPSRSTAGS